MITYPQARTGRHVPPCQDGRAYRAIVRAAGMPLFADIYIGQYRRAAHVTTRTAIARLARAVRHNQGGYPA